MIRLARWLFSMLWFVNSNQFGLLIRPASNSEDRIHYTTEADSSAPVKLDAAAQAHIEKHR